MMYVEFIQYTKVVKKRTVLNSINLAMAQSEIYGITGQNGSGKTMLLRAVSGLIVPTHGQVKINGLSPAETSSSIGLALKPEFWPGLTGFENLAYLASIKHLISPEKIKETMERLNLSPDDKRLVKTYSRGMLQKLNIIQAIMEQQDLILLDEPCDALDEQSLNQFYQVLIEEKKRGATLLIAYHSNNQLDALIDHQIVMTNGLASVAF